MAQEQYINFNNAIRTVCIIFESKLIIKCSLRFYLSSDTRILIVIERLIGIACNIPMYYTKELIVKGAINAASGFIFIYFKNTEI